MEGTAKKIRKGGAVEAVPFGDDYMFSTVMKHKDACMRLIEAVFPERKVADIRYVKRPEPQRTIVLDPLGKGIRMDVYFDDGDTVYDIELQRSNSRELAQRSRMYSALMDASSMKRGEAYGGMRDGYVIFICTFDPFGRGLKRYAFGTVCEGAGGLPLEDGRHIIFLNTRGTEGEESPDMDELFSYINGGAGSIGAEGCGELVRLVDGYVRLYNTDGSWRKEYMKLEFMLRDRYRDGEQAGISQGVAEEKRRMVKSLKQQKVPLEVIAKASSLSVEEVQRIN